MREGLDIFNFLKGDYQPYEPVCLFFGTYSIGTETMPRRAEVIKTVDALRAKGVDAVPFFHKDASDPAKTVVSETGIQTPFIPAGKALLTARQLVDILKSAKIGVRGFIYPIYNEQLPSPFVKEKKKDMLFIEKKVLQAYAEASLFSSEHIKENASLWTGGNLGALPFTIGVSGNSSKGGEARAVTYASPDPNVAKDFCGGVGEFNATRAYESVAGLSYAFLYEFSALPKQEYFKDFGLENMGVNPFIKVVDNPAYETPVFPKANNLESIYLLIKAEDSSLKLFKLPKSEEWDCFLRMHEPTSKSLRGFLKERVLRQREEKAKSYPIFNDEVVRKDYADLSKQSIYELLKNLCDEDLIKCDTDAEGKTHIKCLCDVRMNSWGITKLPSDITELYIEGAFEVRDNPNLKLDNSSMPATKFGVKSLDSFKGMFEAGMQMVNTSDFSK